MEVSQAFDHIETIKIDNPVDKIIKQLKALIVNGQLRPGDRLPSERVLSERFGIGRGYIREAILKLEFYGLLKTSPQSGTFVAGLSLKILDSIVSDIINFNKDDIPSLIEARYYLEINSARIAAQKRTDEDILSMQEAINEYGAKFIQGRSAVDEDLLFHIKLAAATKNSFMESMILVLVPDLIKVINVVHASDGRNKGYVIDEHHNILDAIVQKDADRAASAMEMHLGDIMNIRHALAY